MRRVSVPARHLPQGLPDIDFSLPIFVGFDRGLSPVGDERLTEWMLQFLNLSHIPIDSADEAESTEEKITEHLLLPLDDVLAHGVSYW